MIPVILKNSAMLHSISKEVLFTELGLTWLDALEFPSERHFKKVLKKSKQAMKKQELSVKEKWLSVRFQREISTSSLPPISIRYIDERLGYGVFAEEDLPAGSYIGEYTGSIRKRRGRRDRKNDYCFEYTIGNWVYNPFIIDAKEKGNFTRFINHNDTPNLDPLSVYVDGIMHIIFVTQRAIPKGRQLCYHYGDTFWKKRRQSEILPLS
jgi:uncharacterized protein